MKLTKFVKLRRAIANLDGNFIGTKIAKLEDHLTKRGQELEPQNTALTQEGIYYIDEETGMTTKVVLYIADQQIAKAHNTKDKLIQHGYDDRDIINQFQEYHILRCNILTHAASRGWKDHYRIAQRPDGTFYYRIVRESDGAVSERKVYQEIENQKLFMCRNCLLKVNSLLKGRREFDRELFELKYFFDTDFIGSWCRYEPSSTEKGVLANIYPKDWEEICRIRRAQVQYQCEECNVDLSDPALRKFLHVHQTDHLKKKMAYVRLECLCISCMADQAAHSHLKETPEYKRYVKGMHQLESQI